MFEPIKPQTINSKSQEKQNNKIEENTHNSKSIFVNIEKEEEEDIELLELLNGKGMSYILI